MCSGWGRRAHTWTSSGAVEFVRASLQRQTLPRAAHACACTTDGTASCLLAHLHSTPSTSPSCRPLALDRPHTCQAGSRTTGRCDRLSVQQQGSHPEAWGQTWCTAPALTVSAVECATVDCVLITSITWHPRPPTPARSPGCGVPGGELRRQRGGVLVEVARQRERLDRLHGVCRGHARGLEGEVARGEEGARRPRRQRRLAARCPACTPPWLSRRGTTVLLLQVTPCAHTRGDTNWTGKPASSPAETQVTVCDMHLWRAAGSSLPPSVQTQL